MPSLSDSHELVPVAQRKFTLTDLILADVDAKPYLIEIGRRLKTVGLQAVLIGNAAAALQGAPSRRSISIFIKSKKAAKRPRDLAVIDVLEKALEEETRQQTGKARRGRTRK